MGGGGGIIKAGNLTSPNTLPVTPDKPPAVTAVTVSSTEDGSSEPNLSRGANIRFAASTGIKKR